MDYIFIYYYDENDNLKRVCTLCVDFEDGVASFRDGNGTLLKVNATQIEKIRAY